MRTFFILSLPRSGTAWLSNFLTWGETFCFHEVSFGCESLDDIETAFRRPECPVVGSADTAAILFYRALNQRFPGSKFLFVVRDREAVRKSLDASGFDSSGLEIMGRALSNAIRDTDLNGATIPFEGLFNQHGMRQVWEFLELPGPFPWRRFELLREMNVQDTARFRSDTPEAQQKIAMNMHRFSKLMASINPPATAGAFSRRVDGRP